MVHEEPVHGVRPHIAAAAGRLPLTRHLLAVIVGEGGAALHIGPHVHPGAAAAADGSPEYAAAVLGGAVHLVGVEHPLDGDPLSGGDHIVVDAHADGPGGCVLPFLGRGGGLCPAVPNQPLCPVKCRRVGQGASQVAEIVVGLHAVLAVHGVADDAVDLG